MIKIEKAVKIIIDGDDVQTLSDICEIARRYLSRERVFDIKGAGKGGSIEKMLETIFGA